MARKIATAKENTELFKIKVTCDGNGWDQDDHDPCYALWEATEADIYRRSHTDISECTDTYYGFICPDCGCFTELDAKKLPSRVKSKAKSYRSPWQSDIYD